VSHPVEPEKSGRRRNVELKARDADPERTLAAALALEGVEDRGVLVQRDTYFAAPRGRLKLREQDGAAPALVAYERDDAARARLSTYRLIEVADAPTAREGLAAVLGERVVVSKRRRLLLWSGVRIHLDDVDGLGAFVELEAVAPADSDLSGEHAKVRELRSALRIGDVLEVSYADLLLAAAPDPQLLALARAAAAHAHAPYSRFPVGAAVRTAGGRRYAGANVENAAYPQGQCAEASALGAMVAADGPAAIVEVVVAAPSEQLCAPCGGCRQRLREFGGPDLVIHLADLERVRRTVTLGELLPLSFGPESLGR
jgi:homotetrameric cytidine deaminase